MKAVDHSGPANAEAGTSDRPAARPLAAAQRALRPHRSYLRKLLGALVPIIVVLNLLVAAVFALRAMGMIEAEMETRHRLLLTAQAGAITTALALQEPERVGRILTRMVGDQGVAAARVRTADGRVIAEVGTPDAGLVHEAVTLGELAGADSTTMVEAWFTVARARERLWGSVATGLFHALISALGLVVAVVLINGQLIVQPLRRLTAAIRASQVDGERHVVDWASDDEIGELVSTFNAMQERLDEGEKRRRIFNQQLAKFYNHTPAMLHTVDREGTLIRVSDYWLVATGYAREEVIGRRLAAFLTPDSEARYELDILPAFVSGGETPETPLRLRKRDGNIIDVVLAETVDIRIGGLYPLSLSVMSDVSRMKAAERELVRLALTDPVTGLGNRRSFVEGVAAAVEQLQAQGGFGLAICIDLDRFKRVNDTYGHAAGDKLLVNVGRRLAQASGARALVGRLGGDEFAVFLPCSEADCGSTRFAEHLLAEMRRPIDVGGTLIEPTGSVGIARYPADGTTARDLLKHADLALYRAKKTGRNRVETFDRRLSDALALRHGQEQDIRAGLANDWFEIFVQPIVRLGDGRIAGGEALVRLRHPERGLIQPAAFIGVAEESGLIEALGRVVLEQAAALTPALVAAAGDADFFLSVNLAGAQVNSDLPGLIEGLVDHYGLKSSNLMLEIMETALLDDEAEVNAVLSAVAATGVRFALDDFGTGYSSLNYVNRFPVSLIKIDRSFTAALGRRETPHDRTHALVRTTVTLGRELGLPIVAEGIERVEELDRLRDLAVAYGQGFLFSPPIPAAAFVELVAAAAGRRIEAPPRRSAG